MPRKPKPTDDELVAALADAATATLAEKAAALGLTEKQLRRRLTPEVWAAVRRRLDDDLRAYAALVYKTLAEKTKEGAVTAAERLSKEIGAAEERAVSGGGADEGGPTEIVVEVVRPENKNNRSHAGKKRKPARDS
ncbi:MAG TPA: hypothetical protein VMW93_03290 [bacterium]|nr:hypothetical protein [bacterium]